MGAGWHEGQFDLIPECVGPVYIGYDEAGDRTVAQDDYAKEIARVQQDRPHTRFVVYDHTFEGDRAWFRFTLKWTDPKTGETRTRSGMQVNRIEAGKLAETWLKLLQPGSAWTDAVAQEALDEPAANQKAIGSLVSQRVLFAPGRLIQKRLSLARAAPKRVENKTLFGGRNYHRSLIAEGQW
jgi:hypothetical protein